jgi:hypothetical protein
MCLFLPDSWQDIFRYEMHRRGANLVAAYLRAVIAEEEYGRSDIGRGLRQN